MATILVQIVSVITVRLTSAILVFNMGNYSWEFMCNRNYSFSLATWIPGSFPNWII